MHKTEEFLFKSLATSCLVYSKASKKVLHQITSCLGINPSIKPVKTLNSQVLRCRVAASSFDIGTKVHDLYI